ncbi:MAG: YHS domain-containing protein [Planctomycetota bacterium]
MDTGRMVTRALVAALAVGLVAAGCSQTETARPAGEAPGTAAAVQPDTAAEGENRVVVDPGTQKTCPVMGGDINKEHYVDYEGKRIYFCCPGCDRTFSESPEKYIEKLREKGETLAQLGPPEVQ